MAKGTFPAKVTFDGDTVSIHRDVGWADVVHPIEMIRGVELKTATRWRGGWIRFAVEGEDPPTPIRFYGGPMSAERRAILFDPNAFPFMRWRNDEFRALADAVSAALAEFGR